MSVWNKPEFAEAWNTTYGLDMAKAPLRAGIIYPLLAEDMGEASGLRLVDFGCGNGNLIRHFKDSPFAHWHGVDGGSAILDTARELQNSDPRIAFSLCDLSKPLAPEDKKKLAGFDIATAIFVVEEIPASQLHVFFNTLASAIKPETGRIHIFTQHPSYTFKEDLLAQMSGQPNTKFEGNQGYYDTRPSTYSLNLLNAQGAHPEKAEFHHKPMSVILNTISQAGLYPETVGEVPAGIIKLEDWRYHTPKSGDTPRFLHMKLGHR